MFKVLVLLFLLFVCHLRVTNGALSIEETPQAHFTYADLALYVTKRYISPKTNTLIIKEKCGSCLQVHKTFHDHILQHFLLNFDASMALQLYMGRRYDRPWDYDMFIVDSSYTFDLLRFHIPTSKHEREFHFFIVLSKAFDDPEKRVKEMLDIFKSCLLFNIYNIVIMNANSNGSFSFFSYYLFGPNHCRKVLEVYECNRFENGRLINDFLFPPSKKNFHNCKLRVCAHVLYPMLLFSGDPRNETHLENINLLNGIDGLVLRELSRSLNFSVRLSIPGGISHIGEYLNSTGCFRELEAGKADIALGGFSSAYSKSYVFSASFSYHQSPYVFVVRTDLHFGPIKQLANGYSAQVWLLIAFTMLFATFTIRLIYLWYDPTLPIRAKGRPLFGILTNVVTLLMGNPLQRIPECNALRFLIIAWMLGTLVLRNAYQGNLFDTLRVSRRAPIPHSIGEMIDKQYTFFSHNYVSFYPTNMTILLPNIVARFAMVQNNHKRYATYTVLDSLAAYNQHNWNTSHLAYVDEQIFAFQLAMYFRKHSMLRAFFDYRLKQLMAAGITSHIAKEYAGSRFRMIKKREPKPPRINNFMLTGLYSLYMIINSVALMFFLLELMSKRYKRIKIIMNWVHSIK